MKNTETTQAERDLLLEAAREIIRAEFEGIIDPKRVAIAKTALIQVVAKIDAGMVQ